jgi:hypothetical protein
VTKGYTKPIIDNVPPQAVDIAYYGDVRYDPDDLQPVYLGLHLDKNADTTDNKWKIYKYTYTGTNVTRIQLAYGNWDLRISLF